MVGTSVFRLPWWRMRKKLGIKSYALISVSLRMTLGSSVRYGGKNILLGSFRALIGVFNGHSVIIIPDNTVRNLGGLGDTIRSVAKVATNAKAQVMLTDIGGGADASPEFINAPQNIYSNWGSGITNTLVYVKSSPGIFVGGLFYNSSTVPAYIQILNLASGGTLGTTAPAHSIPIPPGYVWGEPDHHILLSNGLALAATTTATGNTAPSTAINCDVFYF